MSRPAEPNSRGEIFEEGDEVTVLSGKETAKAKEGHPEWRDELDELVGATLVVARVTFPTCCHEERCYIRIAGWDYNFHPDWLMVASQPFNVDTFAKYLKSNV